MDTLEHIDAETRQFATGAAYPSPVSLQTSLREITPVNDFVRQLFEETEMAPDNYLSDLQNQERQKPIPYDSELITVWNMMIPDKFMKAEKISGGRTKETCKYPTTRFRIASPLHNDDKKATLILPGFGVSVGQLGLDQTVWSAKPHTIVTHDAVKYPTSQDFMLWQYEKMLRAINPEELRIIAISLGGSTAMQLLAYLQTNAPELYARIKKVVTLVSPVVAEDLTDRWQFVAKWCKQLADDSEKGADVSRTRQIALDAIYKLGIKQSALEAENPQQTQHIFEYAGHTFGNAQAMQLTPGMFDIPITSFGLERDRMASNTEAQRFSTKGKHIKLSGKHSPRFYAEQKELYDRLILEELA